MFDNPGVFLSPWNRPWKKYSSNYSMQGRVFQFRGNQGGSQELNPRLDSDLKQEDFPKVLGGGKWERLLSKRKTYLVSYS